MLKSSTFFSVFPPPALLNVRCAGVHIADDMIRAIVLNSSGKKYTVANYGERPLPKGLVVGGTITNENALAQEIKALKEKMKLSYVRVSLPEERMYLFNVEFPGVSEIGIRDVIESKLEENIPIPPSEAIYEFDPSEYKGKLITKASISAFSEKLIQSYVSCCTLAGLEVQGFDTEPRAIIRALDPGKETMMVVDISSYNASLFVVSNQVAQFSSTVTFDNIINTPLLEEEVKKVISYWNAREDGSMIKKVIMTGKLAQTDGLVQALGQTLKIPVSIGNVWAGLHNSEKIPPIEFAQSLDYVVAIGLALRE